MRTINILLEVMVTACAVLSVIYFVANDPEAALTFSLSGLHAVWARLL